MNWLENLIAKFAAKKLEKKLNLTEGQVDSKKWYASKSIWSAVIAGGLGIAQAVGSATGHPIVIPEWVYAILGSIGLYSARTAETKIG
jgi:hypothetical protein